MLGVLNCFFSTGDFPKIPPRLMDIVLELLVSLTMDCIGKMMEDAKEIAYVEMRYVLG